MGSSVQYSLLAGFKAVNAWQQNIIRNATGLLQPGYNRINLQMGGTASADLAPGQDPTASGGSRSATFGGGDTLSVGPTSVDFQQGDLMPADSPTSLAVLGKGFFVVAENLRPGARLFLTRAGDFHFDNNGRLVNSQGLFVVGGSGTLSDPPQPITANPDGSVPLGQISLARVAVPDLLQISGYGATVYQLPPAAGPLQTFQNGRPEVGFVQTNSLEFASRIGLQSELTVESTQAQQTYKMFKDMLDTYNKSVDDAINMVK